jgi:hypothetical protein
MDEEVSRHYQVLGLNEGCSEGEIEEAYQERAQAWNPGRFSRNEQLRLSAQEKLRHITTAYEFLRARKARILLAPQQETTPARGRLLLWTSAAVIILLSLGAALLLLWGTEP